MSFLMSIFDRLGVDLGSVLGVIFGRFGALVGPSWSQDRLRTVLNFHEISAGVVFGAFPGPQDGIPDGSRSPQDGPKIVLDRFFFS